MAIDRIEFLQMCQKISVLKSGVCGVKENVPNELKVIHNGIVYYPVAYELSFNKGNPIHTAILHDIKANAIQRASLERIGEYEQTRSNCINKTKREKAEKIYEEEFENEQSNI